MNIGGSISTAKFDEDWSPTGPQIRADLLKCEAVGLDGPDLIRLTLRGRVFLPTTPK